MVWDFWPLESPPRVPSFVKIAPGNQWGGRWWWIESWREQLGHANHHHACTQEAVTHKARTMPMSLPDSMFRDVTLGTWNRPFRWPVIPFPRKWGVSWNSGLSVKSWKVLGRLEQMGYVISHRRHSCTMDIGKSGHCPHRKEPVTYLPAHRCLGFVPQHCSILFTVNQRGLPKPIPVPLHQIYGYWRGERPRKLSFRIENANLC